MCIELNNRALEKKNQKNNQTKKLPQEPPSQKTPQQNQLTPQKQQHQKNPTSTHLLFSSILQQLGLISHVKIELIKRSALASILFALHSIL